AGGCFRSACAPHRSSSSPWRPAICRFSPGRSRAKDIEPMTPDPWLEAHSYLRPLADLSAQVDRAAAGISVLDARIPGWADYRADVLAGVPLLTSADAGVDLEPGGRMAGALVEGL